MPPDDENAAEGGAIAFRLLCVIMVGCVEAETPWQEARMELRSNAVPPKLYVLLPPSLFGAIGW